MQHILGDFLIVVTIPACMVYSTFPYLKLIRSYQILRLTTSIDRIHESLKETSSYPGWIKSPHTETPTIYTPTISHNTCVI